MSTQRIFFAGALLLATGLMVSNPAQAQRGYGYQSHGSCSDYAADTVRRYGKRGRAVGGAVGGAIGGAVVGRIIGGKRTARRGAALGGLVGAIRGGSRQRRENDDIYDRAYDDCMRGRW